METLSEQRVFGGVQGFYRHESAACGGPMKFGVYVPPLASSTTRCPVLYYLAGLTCTEETFAIKAGAQRLAADLGLVLVTMDTSPRSARYPGDDESWDFGLGAGFYLDATEAPWSATYRMETYAGIELPALVEASFPIDAGARGIFGHSMGGHGALTLALRHPHRYRSVSAFSPIVAPSQVPWGQKAFSRYLGEDRPRRERDRAAWLAYDATALVEKVQLPFEILIDQGTADKFLDRELRPELFEQACKASGQRVRVQRREGFDHSYWFIQTFVGDHLAYHAALLRA